MFTSINPATGEKIGVYEELTSAEIEAKLNKAVSIFQQWRTTTLSERAELLGNIADQFDANKDRLARSEEHTSELQSLMRISYDVFCLKKKNTQHITKH